MSKKVNSDRISPTRLEDQWHTLLLSAFLKIRDAVQTAKARGLDQKQIGDRIGMDDAQLSRILKGDANITLRTMHKIARAVDCRLDIELTDLTTVKKSNARSWEWSPLKPVPKPPLSFKPVANADFGAGKSQSHGHWIGLKDAAKTGLAKEHA